MLIWMEFCYHLTESMKFKRSLGIILSIPVYSQGFLRVPQSAVCKLLFFLSGLNESQTGIKFAERNINNLRYIDDTTLIAESEQELKNLLMNVKEESEKAGLKLNIQKTKIMASGPITSWEIDGETVGTVSGLLCLGPKISADGDCTTKLNVSCSLEEKLWPTWTAY